MVHTICASSRKEASFLMDASLVATEISLDSDLASCYVTSLLFIIIVEYLTSCLAILNIFIEIFLTAQRICVLSAIRMSIFKKEYLNRVCSAFVAISLLIYTPVLFMNKIDPAVPSNQTKNSNYPLSDYVVNKTEFGQTRLGIGILNALTIFRIVLVGCVLSGLNVVAIVKYRAYFSRKLSLINLKRKTPGIYLTEIIKSV
jgi:hypothetical protein